MSSRYDNIIDEIKKYQFKTFIEVGTCCGRTALKIIKASIDCGNNPSDIYYFGFDLFEDLNNETFKKEVAKRPRTENQVKEILNATKANIKLFKGYSKDTIPNSNIEIPIDLIFLDGGHSPETVETDWKNIQKYISNKTITIFDDYLDRFDEHRWGCNNVINNLDPKKWNIFKYLNFDKFRIGCIFMIKVVQNENY